MTHFHSPGPPSDEFRQRMRRAHKRLAAGSAGSELAARWAPTLIAVAFCQFAYFTLFPLDFTLHTGQHWDLRPYDPTDLFDWVMNIILAFPVGFALAGFAAGKGWRAWKMFLFAGGVTCLCSSTVECLQLFLPGRVSAIADIFSNTTGGLVGCFCFVALGKDFVRVINFIARQSRRRLVGSRALGALLIVVALVCAVPAYLLRRPRLVTWNSNFPLLIGNENDLAPGDSRQWSGTLTNLHIANRAADPIQQVPPLLAHGNFANIMGDSVIADYRLVGPGPYVDASHHLPDLAWAHQSPPNQFGAKARFADPYFLSTQTPAAALVNAITDTDSFTISFVYATDSFHQSGPARLLTISKNIYTRDFTIGQQDADLDIRLRTRGTGANGQHPEWRIPNFFRDFQPHALLITYDGDILRVFQDTQERQWRVRTPPEYAILAPILAREDLTMPINGTGNLPWVALFYTLCNLPIALVLGLILAEAVRPISVKRLPPIAVRMFWPVFGFLLSVTALYVTVDRLGIRAMGWTEFPLSAFIFAIETAIFGHWWSRGPARLRPEPPMVQVTFLGDATELPRTK